MRVTAFLTDLVGTIVAGDFLTENEDRFVTEHLFLHGCVKRLANRHL
jgi:hypothetical protein